MCLATLILLTKKLHVVHTFILAFTRRHLLHLVLWSLCDLGIRLKPFLANSLGWQICSKSDFHI